MTKASKWLTKLKGVFMDTVTCEICGQQVKNLGVHKYHNHRENVPEENVSQPKEKIVIDSVTEKPLSTLISEMKSLLNRYQNTMTVKISEKSGKPFEVELTVRIQL